MTSNTTRFLTFFCAVLALSFIGGTPVSQAGPIEIFHEDFNSFTGFPASSNDVGGHQTNFGVPTIAEGAENDWIAARLEASDSGPISDDVGVMKSGTAGTGTSGAPFDNPVGRVGDDAGLVIKIDLSQYVDAELALDWRTFSVSTSDRFVVAYFVGDGLGDPTPAGVSFDWFNDASLGMGDISAADPFTGTPTSANPWYLANWTELIRATGQNNWQIESGLSLPVGDVLYVAFWLDNGDGDVAKIDNISITATIPEPSSMVLLGLGLAGSLVRVRQRNE